MTDRDAPVAGLTDLRPPEDACPSPAPDGPRRRSSLERLGKYAYRVAGLSIIEVLVVLTIMLGLMGIGAPLYARARDRAMVVRAIADISTLQKDIAIYRLDHAELPDSLARVGSIANTDPWGAPYQYLKFTWASTGTGRGNGSSASGSSTTETSGGAGSSSSSAGTHGGGGSSTGGGGGSTGAAAGGGSTGGGSGSRGTGSGAGSTGTGQEPRPEEKDVRRDRHEKPLNSDYDLYSKGKDGQTKPQLTAELSRDDVIRAHDGAFIGLAEDF